MVKVLTHDIPDYKIKLETRQLQATGKKIEGKPTTQATNGTPAANRRSHHGQTGELIFVFNCGTHYLNGHLVIHNKNNRLQGERLEVYRVSQEKVYTFNEPLKSDHCIDLRNLTWIRQNKPEIRS